MTSALTLDESALWIDMQDDPWNKRADKSIDAAASFAGLLTMGAAGGPALSELLGFERRAGRPRNPVSR